VRSGKVSQRRVLICGAGIAGPSLAHWLLRHGFEPTLIERAPAFRAGGYIIDVWGVGFDMLERYGLLDAARDRGYLFDRLRFVDASGRERSAVGGQVFRRALGGRFFSIARGDLAQVIYETVANRMEVRYGTSVHALHSHPDGVEVELSSGEARAFDIVVGADGLHSRVRELTFGAQSRYETYLGYLAASFVADEYPHRDEGVYVSFARPGRQVSRYAMRENRSAFLFVLADAGEALTAAHDIRAQRELLRARFAGDGWELPQILARLEASHELYFDAVSQIRMPRWTEGRIALIGDAAHSPSLLAGAGSAFAMLGAYILAHELHCAGGNAAHAFAAYEQRLRPYIERQQRVAARFAGSFTPKTPVGIRIRDAVLNLMNVPGVGGLLARGMFANNFPLPLE
jgi:2-polyprenyl-6-methoxyphenol hydroxylase-like FAD-dependent oxidoreductase